MSNEESRSSLGPMVCSSERLVRLGYDLTDRHPSGREWTAADDEATILAAEEWEARNPEDDVFKVNESGETYIDEEAQRRMAEKLVSRLDGIPEDKAKKILDASCATLDAILRGEVSLADLGCHHKS